MTKSIFYAGRAALAAVLLMGAVVSARAEFALSPADQAALKRTTESFVTALKRGDGARIMRTLPPKLLTAMAQRFNVTVDQVIEATDAQMRETLKSTRFDSIDLDPANLEEGGVTEDGLVYGFIPTNFAMTINGESLNVDTEVFALREGGQWYLLRLDDPAQIEVLADVYPSLVGVFFEPGEAPAAR